MKKLIFLGVAILCALIAGFYIWTEQRMSGAHGVLISDAQISIVSNSDKLGMVTLKLANSGVPQTLLSVRSDDGASAWLMGVEDGKPAVLPGNGSASLAADGAHIMVRDISGPLEEGRLINVRLMLEPAGEIITKARLVDDRLAAHGNHGAMHSGSDGVDAHALSKGHPVPQSEPQPSLLISVTQESESDWHLTAKIDKFKLSKELADGEHVPGTGHGHIYLNGLKLGRLYQERFTIGSLPKGTHTVRVTLNTNDHRAVVVEGKPVAAVATITVE